MKFKNKIVVFFIWSYICSLYGQASNTSLSIVPPSIKSFQPHNLGINCNYITNPSFEGPSGIYQIPPSWTEAGGSPDTYALGLQGVIIPPHTGNSCLGLGGDLDYNEAVTQSLSTCLQAGKTYTLNFWLNSSIDLIMPVYTPTEGQLFLYGDIQSGSNLNSFILWQSSPISFMPNWRQYQAQITPTVDICQITLQARRNNPFLLGGTVCYMLIDDLSISANVEATITSITPITCGINQGGASIGVLEGCPPYSYLWSNGATTQNLSNINAAGEYTLWVTDAHGSIDTLSVTIPTNSTLSAVIADTTVSSCNANTGSVNINVSGGTPSYIYQWSNNSNNEDLNNLAPGVYSLTVTEQGGCSAYVSVTINNSMPSVVIGILQQPTCLLPNDGVLAAISNCSNPQYQWSNSESSDLIQNLTSGTYSVTLTDPLGCTASAQESFTLPLYDFVIRASVLEKWYCNRDSLEVFALNNQSYPMASFEWISPSGIISTGSSIVITEPGTYTVIGTNALGCSTIKTHTFSYDPLPIIDIRDIKICPNDSVRVYPPSNNSVYTDYVWQNSLGGYSSSTSIMIDEVGDYYLIAQTANGCELRDTFSVNIINLNISSSDTLVCPNASVQLTASLDIPYANACNNYDVIAIPYTPYTPVGNVMMGPSGQGATTNVNIPFGFDFFCNTYHSFYISTNGFIGFNNGNNNGGFEGQLIPRLDPLNNIIALCWVGLEANNNITYWIEGTSPNRKLIIDFNNLTYISNNNSYIKGQIVIFEYNSDIELFVTNITNGQNSFQHQTQGIENVNGSIAYTINNRSASFWSAHNEGWRLHRIPPPSYTWQPTSTLSSSNISNPVATPNETTTYNVYSTWGECNITDSIIINTYPLPLIDAWIESPLLNITYTSLSQVVNAGVINNSLTPLTFNWYPGDLVNTINTPNIQIVGNTTGQYQLYVNAESIDGCIATDSVTLIVGSLEEDIIFPNTFTPNNDGSNDVFHPLFSIAPVVDYFKIYDRWGNEIYNNSDIINNAWDGTFNGVQLPSDNYIYVLKVKNYNSSAYSIIKGSVILIR